MADLSARVVSAPQLIASTDFLVVQVTSASGAPLADVTFEVSLSPSASTPTDVWWPAGALGPVVSLLVGQESPVGRLSARTWWVQVRAGDVVVPAGPFVLRGDLAPALVPDNGDIDGGEVTA